MMLCSAKVFRCCCVVMFFSSIISSNNAFVITNNNKLNHKSAGSISNQKIKKRSNTVLYIEDWVADMIDSELFRLNHKEEFDRQLGEQNRKVIMNQVNKEIENKMMEYNESDFRQKLKDKKLALRDPQRYCKDRCITTGNCDIYEDFFDFSPQEVIEFCNECVLSEDNETCDIPDAFYDNDNFDESTLKP